MKILALSSSKCGSGGYLQTALPAINALLGDAPVNIAFIPFASVDANYELYTAKVREALQTLPYAIFTVTPDNARQVLESCDAVMVGGGNTFKLLHDIYANNLFNLIQTKVQNGLPYIGWSAGANLTGITIGTTNDMPIVQPESFKAFEFLPLQINPHYKNFVISGFHGESRDQRLEEYLSMNPQLEVIGLPEGCWLMKDGNTITYDGRESGVQLYLSAQGKMKNKPIKPGDRIVLNRDSA